jgi:N-acetylmuramoyl-L-alanine amidase CwlA
MSYTINRNYISKGNSRSGAKISKVRFIVAHDTGNPGSSASGNRSYFQNSQPSASAHTFIDHKEILEIVPLDEKAWHVLYQKPIDNQMYGDDSNDAAIGVELCYGGNIDNKEAYKRYVWYMKYLCDKFGLDPKKHIVGHYTLDPGRKTDPMNAFKLLGITWNDFISDVAGEEVTSSANKTPSKSTGKSNNQIAQEVIAGKWGNGTDRESSLKKSGYNPDTIQNEVNAILSGGSKPKAATKSINTIANEVIAGKWSSGDDRKSKLKKAGYDANKVQAEVNRILGAGTTKKKSSKSIDQMAKEVIAGKHGNGHDNRRKSLGISASEYAKVRSRVNQLL